MGVRLMNLASGDSVVALARNAESAAVDEVAEAESEPVEDAVENPVENPVENAVDEDPGND
jgi:DNA gyrase subunit A